MAHSWQLKAKELKEKDEKKAPPPELHALKAYNTLKLKGNFNNYRVG
jgi:hypothetical protein